MNRRRNPEAAYPEAAGLVLIAIVYLVVIWWVV